MSEEQNPRIKIQGLRAVGVDRVEVELEGRESVRWPRELVVMKGLSRGRELEEGEFRALAREASVWEAKRSAMNLLSVRERSEQEVKRRLVQKGFDVEVVTEAVDALQRSGLISDARYAESFVRDRVAVRPQGKFRMMREMGMAGVDEDLALTFLEGVLEEKGISEVDLAREAAAKWRQRAGEDVRKARNRLYSFLARRGFGVDAIRVVLDEKLGEGAEGEEEVWG